MTVAADAPGHTGSGGFGRAFASVAGTAYVLLALGWCALIGMLPLVAAWIVAPIEEYWPAWCLAYALSVPGIAALFAVFRDQPALLSHLSMRRTLQRPGTLPDWIAPPYARFDDTHAVFRPYVQAYRRVGLRALMQGGIYGLLLFIAAYDAQIVTQFESTRFLSLVFLVCAALLAQASVISLILLVEYPKARWLSLLRNGVMCSVRRLYIAPLAWIVFIGWWWGLAQSTLLVAFLATGVVAYVIWGSARWQADMLMVKMAQETGDESVIAMYQGDANQPHRSFFSSMTDFRQ